MGLLRRIFGPALESTPQEPVEIEGHTHAPDADPDDVVVPKQKKSSKSLISGKPPLGWKREVSEDSGGIWPWSGADSHGGGDYSGGDSGGGGSGGGD